VTQSPGVREWTFPGGQVDEGEDALQAALREWREETGTIWDDASFSAHSLRVGRQAETSYFVFQVSRAAVQAALENGFHLRSTYDKKIISDWSWRKLTARSEWRPEDLTLLDSLALDSHDEDTGPSDGRRRGGPSTFLPPGVRSTRRDRASRQTERWQKYVTVFSLLHGRPPRVLDLFCGGGGQSRGVLQIGCYATGIDFCEQPAYPADQWGCDFMVADVMSLSAKEIRERYQPDVIIAGPPCQGYSSSPHLGGNPSEAPRLIVPLKALLDEVGVPYYIENVAGSSTEMRRTGNHVVRLCGCRFGLGLFKARFFCSNVPLVNDLGACD
jgi:ADP-ribose pyrophosphatase YjhB (NUDIX family)